MSAKNFQEKAGSVKTAKVAILYDHLDTILAANQFVDRLPSSAGKKVEWMANSWRFDALRMGHTLEAYRALEETADADLILVAICDPGALADVPADWLEYWADFRRLRNAKLIVMLFGLAANSAELAPLIENLRRLAEVHDVSFSIFCDATPGDGARGNSETTPGSRVSPDKRNSFETAPCVPA
jgi:hypothetical protein